MLAAQQQEIAVGQLGKVVVEGIGFHRDAVGRRILGGTGEMPAALDVAQHVDLDHAVGAGPHLVDQVAVVEPAYIVDAMVARQVVPDYFARVVHGDGGGEVGRRGIAFRVPTAVDVEDRDAGLHACRIPGRDQGRRKRLRQRGRGKRLGCGFGSKPTFIFECGCNCMSPVGTHTEHGNLVVRGHLVAGRDAPASLAIVQVDRQPCWNVGDDAQNGSQRHGGIRIAHQRDALDGWPGGLRHGRARVIARRRPAPGNQE